MSITFGIVGEKSHCEEYCDECFAQVVNMSNSNAFAVMQWLGMDPVDYGQMPARELAMLCKRACASQPLDPGTYGQATYTPGHATLVECGRRPGYFQDRAQALLALAMRAGDLGQISWG